MHILACSDGWQRLKSRMKSWHAEGWWGVKAKLWWVSMAAWVQQRKPPEKKANDHLHQKFSTPAPSDATPSLEVTAIWRLPMRRDFLHHTREAALLTTCYKLLYPPLGLKNKTKEDKQKRDLIRDGPNPGFGLMLHAIMLWWGAASDLINLLFIER